MGLTVVIGGTRSGKSAHAEALATATALPVRYVATANGQDPSMRARIDTHVARRPATWTTVEAGASLADGFADAGDQCVLLDGLGPWIAARLEGSWEAPERLAQAGEQVLAEVARAAEAAACAGAAIVVAEQAGEGLLPLDAGSRAWLDLLGEATQRFAAVADHVVLVTAGRATTLGDAVPRRAAPPRAATFAAASAEPPRAATLAAASAEPPRAATLAAASAEPPRAATLAAASAGPLDAAPPSAAPAHAASAAPLNAAPPSAAPAHAASAAPPDPAPARHPIDHAALRRHGDRDVRPGDADHAVNVVAGGPPPWLRAALDTALDDVAATYPREDEAIQALASMHERAPDEIVPTNGAAEALWLLGPALRPRLAACVHPGFTETEAALHAHGIPVVRVQRDPDHDFALDPAAVPDEADLVVVGNPASPSGTLDPATAILALRRPGRTVVVDEAFMDLVPGEVGSLAGTKLDDVIVTRSLTKVLAIPGLRAGYAIAPQPLADRLRAVRPPWSANALALAALIAATEHPAELAAIAETVASERADLYARLQAIQGVRAWPGAANFVLIAVADGPAVVAALRAQRIAVRPAASFPGLDDRYIRVTARDPERNQRVATAIEAAL